MNKHYVVCANDISHTKTTELFMVHVKIKNISHLMILFTRILNFVAHHSVVREIEYLESHLFDDTKS